MPRYFYYYGGLILGAVLGGAVASWWYSYVEGVDMETLRHRLNGE